MAVLSWAVLEDSTNLDKTFCACGCKNQFVPFDNRGRLRRFIHGHNPRGLHPKINPTLIKRGKDNPMWKGGRYKSINGYIRKRCEGHPRATQNGYYVMEHILVVEEYLKACILTWCDVHHINGIKDDNRIENLQLLPHSVHSHLSNLKRAGRKQVL
jgi:hypothetical protein